MRRQEAYSVKVRLCCRLINNGAVIGTLINTIKMELQLNGEKSPELILILTLLFVLKLHVGLSSSVVCSKTETVSHPSRLHADVPPPVGSSVPLLRSHTLCFLSVTACPPSAGRPKTPALPACTLHGL